MDAQMQRSGGGCRGKRSALGSPRVARLGLTTALVLVGAGCSLAFGIRAEDYARGDASAGADAGPDAGADAGPDAGPVDYCAGAAFCDQFERSTPLGSWQTTTVSPGSSLSMTNERARSGTTSLRLTFGTATPTYALLQTTMQASRKTKLTFSAYVESAVARIANIGGLAFGFAGDRTISVYFSALGDSGQISVIELEATNGTNTIYKEIGTTPLVVGRWFELSIEVDQRNATPVLSVTSEGATVLDHVALAGSFNVVRPLVNFGSGYANAGPAWQIDFDDARVDITP